MRSDCGKVPFPNRIRFAFALLYEWGYGEGRAKVGRCLVDRGLRFLFLYFSGWKKIPLVAKAITFAFRNSRTSSDGKSSGGNSGFAEN